MSEWSVHNAIRPSGGSNGLRFGTREELIEAIEDYFLTAKNNEKPLTVPSLARAIGITTDTLCKYGARQQFADIVLNAMQYIEAWTAEATFDKDTFQGAKLNLDIYYKKISNIKMHMSTDNSDVADMLRINRERLIGQLTPELRTAVTVIDAEINNEDELNEPEA